MVCFVFASEQEQLAVESARRFAKCFAEVAAGQPDIPLRLLGPAECTPYRVAGRYRCRILIKCRNNRRFRALVRDVLQRSSAGQESVYPAIDCRYDSNL
jgi:primosomal protein N' (replication factor Y)